MVSTTAPFSLQQIGTGTSRFPSGVALPTMSDASVDPYIRTRPIKTVQVECIEFWPQEFMLRIPEYERIRQAQHSRRGGIRHGRHTGDEVRLPA